MIDIENFKSRFSSIVPSENLNASYPSSEWCTGSWTLCLLRDFENFLLKFDPTASRIWFRKKKWDRYSHHFDFTRKLALYKKLKNRPFKNQILIPECGPAALEVAMARLAGYQSIVAFDLSEAYVKCAQGFYPDVHFFQTDSKSVDYETFRTQNFDLVVPHWGHFNTPLHWPESHLIVSKNQGGRFDEHLQDLNWRDFVDFHQELRLATMKLSR